jgi:hypothetical protein
MNVPNVGQDPAQLLKGGEYTDLVGTGLPTPEDVEMSDRVLPDTEPVPREAVLRKRITEKRFEPSRPPS